MSYHLEHEEHNLTVCSAVASLAPDLVFVSMDGEQVEASSFLLSLHSPLLQNLLVDRGDSRDVTALSMPLSASGIHTLLALLSTGRALGSSEQDLREVVEQAASVLGVPLDNLQLGRRAGAKTQPRPQQQQPKQLTPEKQLVGNSQEALDSSLEDPVEPVACATCSKVFSAQSYLDKHTMAKHGEENIVVKREIEARPFSCDLCKREFKQASHLKTHVTKVHQPKIEKVEEDVLAADDTSEKINVEEAPSGMIIPEISVNEVVLAKYTETAVTIEPAEPKCSLCDETKGGESALIEHKQTVHVKTSQDGETFECEFCGFKTQKINFIKTHVKFMHKYG